MADPSLLGGFDLPFQEQIDFFRQKLNLPTAAWDDIWQAAHDRAFVVAGASKADLLNDLRQAVDKAISTGTTLETFRKEFRQIVADRGWHGWTGEGTTGGFNWRTKVIYETNLRTAHAAGRAVQLADPGLQALLPFRRYIHNDSVLNPRPQHLAWHGLTLPHDHPFWQTHMPPNGWSCFPAETQVRCNALVGLKTWYAGEMVELESAAGKRLTVTANHPVLTSQGWVAAGKVEQGDHLIGAVGEIDAALVGVVNHQEPPTSAENLFEALATQGVRVVPMAPDDFHGDARQRKPEIHIAGADGVLVDIANAQPHQLIGESRFDFALHRRVEPAGVSIGTPLAAAMVANAILAQDAADGRLGDPQPAGDLCLADEAGTVERNHLALGVVVSGVGSGPGRLHERAGFAALADANPAAAHPVAAIADFDAVQAQDSPQGIPAGAQLFGKLLEANAGQVAADEVIAVRKFDWAGHVYDFSTNTGLIIAGGLVVSNCRCRVAAVLKPKPGDKTAPPEGWDELDEKTGAPVGIDKGWAYAPGQSHVDELRRLVDEKQAKLPPELGAALENDVAGVVRRG